MLRGAYISTKTVETHAAPAGLTQKLRRAAEVIPHPARADL
jgi:hypothetical protein